MENNKKENKLIAILAAVNEALFLVFTASIFGVLIYEIFSKCVLN